MEMELPRTKSEANRSLARERPTAAHTVSADDARYPQMRPMATAQPTQPRCAARRREPVPLHFSRRKKRFGRPNRELPRFNAAPVALRSCNRSARRDNRGCIRRGGSEQPARSAQTTTALPIRQGNYQRQNKKRQTICPAEKPDKDATPVARPQPACTAPMRHEKAKRAPSRDRNQTDARQARNPNCIGSLPLSRIKSAESAHDSWFLRRQPRPPLASPIRAG